MRVLYLSLAALFTVSACSRSDRSAEVSIDPAAEAGKPAADRAVKAAMIANAIAAMPAAGDSILKASGYTRESFQKLMYEIAADSAASAAYASAKTR